MIKIKDNEEVNIEKLVIAWDTTGRSTTEDWEEWMRTLSLEFLKQSPSDSLRNCYSISQVNPGVARYLFPAGLLSCWSILNEKNQNQLLDALETILKSPASLTDIVQPIISLLEFLVIAKKENLAYAPNLKNTELFVSRLQSILKESHYNRITSSD